MFNGKIHYKWPFSIAMLNYQRVAITILHRLAKSTYNGAHLVFKWWDICETYVKKMVPGHPMPW